MTQSGSYIDPCHKYQYICMLAWVNMQTGNVRDTAEDFYF